MRIPLHPPQAETQTLLEKSGSGSLNDREGIVVPQWQNLLEICPPKHVIEHPKKSSQPRLRSGIQGKHPPNFTLMNTQGSVPRRVEIQHLEKA